MNPKPANALKHLGYPGRKKPECWKCIYWTGRPHSGQIVCGLEIDRCAYERASRKLMRKRRRHIPKLFEPCHLTAEGAGILAELNKIDDYELAEFKARSFGHYLARLFGWKGKA